MLLWSCILENGMGRLIMRKKGNMIELKKIYIKCFHKCYMPEGRKNICINICHVKDLKKKSAITRTVVNLARRIAEYGRDMMVPKALSANDMLNRLAVTLQRGNAFLISSSFTAALAGGQEGPELASVP
jgi:hypothetical protein